MAFHINESNITVFSPPTNLAFPEIVSPFVNTKLQAYSNSKKFTILPLVILNELRPPLKPMWYIYSISFTCTSSLKNIQNALIKLSHNIPRTLIYHKQTHTRHSDYKGSFATARNLNLEGPYVTSRVACQKLFLVFQENFLWRWKTGLCCGLTS